jgi:hypothetical protein
MNWPLPKSVLAILFLFGTMLLFVTLTAYVRKSGNTKMDTSKMQNLRDAHEFNSKK